MLWNLLKETLAYKAVSDFLQIIKKTIKDIHGDHIQN